MSKTTQTHIMTRTADIELPKKCPYRKTSLVEGQTVCVCQHPANKLLKHKCLIIGKKFPQYCPLKEKILTK